MLRQLVALAFSMWRLRAALAPRLFRVALLATVVLVVLCGALLSVGRARVDDALVDLGRHLSSFAEVRGSSDGRAVMMNGQPLGFRMTVSELPVSRILDSYEAGCRRGQSGLVDRPLVPEIIPPPDWRDLTLRGGTRDAGYVACITSGTRRRSTETLLTQVERFLASGNLGELGRFHYLFAEPGATGTRVIAVWTDGAFYPGELFPSSGDAPGSDVPGIPRPPGGRRILSVGEVGHPQSLTVYGEAVAELPELVALYRRAFASRRWRVHFDEPDGPDLHGFVVERAGRLHVITVGVDETSGSYVAVAVAN